MTKPITKTPGVWTVEEVRACLARNDPEELLYLPIWVSMDPPGRVWSESICVRLSKHPHCTVRGNAVLGFGHLARTCRYLNQRLVQPIIEAALRDEDKYVRGQAQSAADDVEFFLGWTIMKSWAPIRYRGFWDVPRIFLMTYEGKCYLFDCLFDEEADDYPHRYRIYLMPELTEDELAGSWAALSLKAIQELGEVPVRQVRFDSSKRREVDASILEQVNIKLPTQ